MPIVVEPSTLSGRLTAPPSKSAMQRAVACAGLARGETLITNPSYCDDALAALRAAEALGYQVERGASGIFIENQIRPGRGDAEASLRDGALGDIEPLCLDCGESALCMRMYASIAALSGRPAQLRAQGSLMHRSMAAVERSLRDAGVSCQSDGGLPPLLVRGPLKGGRFSLDCGDSSQFLTGFLIALAAAEGDSELLVSQLASGGYIDLTLGVMRRFGASVERDDAFSRFVVRGRHGSAGYEGCRYEVEGDWSAASFLLVAGALASGKGTQGARAGAGASTGVRIGGLDPESAQPDRAVLAALESAGAPVSYDGGYHIACPSGLRGFSFDAAGCPDLAPPLVALASRCEGTSRIAGVRRLRGKESDRAAALAQEFSALGLPVIVEGDELVVRPEGGAAEPMAGGRADARGDHRIAMALSVAALGARAPVGIRGAACVAKSYPEFFRDMAALGASLSGLPD